jgi:hypothetical protein
MSPPSSRSLVSDQPKKITGFFSYSRSDDANTRGGLSKLHERIQSELRLRLGRDQNGLELWKDTGAIRKGQEWQRKIEEAAARSVFFITVASPAALNSPHCRFEFEAFIKRESGLGRNDLMFPIFYVDIPELKDAAQRDRHPMLGVLHKRQYLDWRDFHSKDPWKEDMSAVIQEFCKDITQALHLPWLPPEEQRLLDAEEANRAAEAAARAAEEAQRVKSEQARARAVVAEERARRAAEARRTAEETWKTVSQMARTRFDGARQAIQEAWTEQAKTPIWKLVLMPWKPLETQEQARALGRFGVGSLAVLSAVFLLQALIAGGSAAFVFVLLAIASGVCAVGTSRNSRVAALVGFLLSFVAFYLLAPLFVFAAVKSTSEIQKPGGLQA